MMRRGERVRVCVSVGRARERELGSEEREKAVLQLSEKTEVSLVSQGNYTVFLLFALGAHYFAVFFISRK